jgi:hypothetical protein
MNLFIRQHFDTIEVRLIESPVIISYRILRREIGPSDGKIRIKVMLGNGGALELFEYVAESDANVQLLKYSFHWQSPDGTLKRRWDNAPHYPELPNAPHHVHCESEVVQEIIDVPDVFSIIEEIEAALKKS